VEDIAAGPHQPLPGHHPLTFVRAAIPVDAGRSGGLRVGTRNEVGEDGGDVDQRGLYYIIRTIAKT
jgi:hypothetical protein